MSPASGQHAIVQHVVDLFRQSTELPRTTDNAKPYNRQRSLLLPRIRRLPFVAMGNCPSLPIDIRWKAKLCACARLREVESALHMRKSFEVVLPAVMLGVMLAPSITETPPSKFTLDALLHGSNSKSTGARR